MAISDRLREERLRLSMSQTAFAALAGVTKSAQIKWEGGASSAPTAPALAAWAEAGVDVLYILTGRRMVEREDNARTQIEDQLAGIRRDLVDPSRIRLPGETESQAESRVLAGHRGALKAMLQYDSQFLTEDQAIEVEHLLDIVENPASLALYRAADIAQMRRKRREKKDQVAEYLVGGEYEPGDAVVNTLTTMALEYDVPDRFIGELYHELNEDVMSWLRRRQGE